jgi:hypothetical protein
LAKKLKSLKLDLKKWNEEDFGNVLFKKNSLFQELQALESIEESRVLTEEERITHARIKMELEKYILFDEISWRQKSRALWLREGDKNTKFFHRVANSNRRNNTIGKLCVDGELTEDHEAIKVHIVNFYQSLYKESGVPRPLLDGLEFISLETEDVQWLERQFDEEEITEVIKGFNGDKAPGPDGFPLSFFQHCWSIVKDDMLAVFREFHSQCSFERSLNATFLTLIPKKSEAFEVKDFRPISLVGSVYKVLAKVLANRLRLVLEKIISGSQNAFVRGRQILDSILIANECLDRRLKAGDPGVLCKLDLEKAYDHVNWGFLDYMLQRCSFSDKWRTWISFCVSTVRFSVLINGTSCGFFESTRGLRQGDPLSPLLFVIVMEALSRMLDRAIDGGFLSGFQVGSEEANHLMVSHLLFADDTLIFCEADPDQILNLGFLLTWFEAISGLKVNLAKSEMVQVGDVPHVGELAGILGCSTSSLPMKYLGLPLGAKFKAKEIWNEVLEKMERQLAGWKRLYLSKGGRLTLIKSTLSNLPTYFLSLFSIPATVARRMEQLQRDFLWGGLGEEFKFHLVNWDSVCSPVQCGGLAVKNLRLYNKALLGKWLWRFGKERGALWRRLVEMKYGSAVGGWCTIDVRTPYGVSLWKFIRQGWGNFLQHLRFDAGNGVSIRFWHDVWCGEAALKESFPDLFRLARNKEALVAQYMQVHNASTHWELDFIRPVQDWEMESLSSFLNLLYSVQVQSNNNDKLCWKPTPQLGFKVSSYYEVLNRREDYTFPWKSIWKPKVPSRVSFFVWVASLGKILTADNLRTWNIILVSWCCLCKADGETVDHLLLHCAFSKEVWDMVFVMFGVSWTMPRTVRGLLACWQGSSGKHRHIEIWRCVPHCLMWCIWRERNLRSFEGDEQTVADLKNIFLKTLFDWVNASGCFPCENLLDFLDLCSFQV